MIVRILGEGQLRVDDAATDELNVLDAALGKAVNAGDEQAFRPALPPCSTASARSAPRWRRTRSSRRT